MRKILSFLEIIRASILPLVVLRPQKKDEPPTTRRRREQSALSWYKFTTQNSERSKGDLMAYGSSTA